MPRLSVRIAAVIPALVLSVLWDPSGVRAPSVETPRPEDGLADTLGDREALAPLSLVAARREMRGVEIDFGRMDL